MLTRPGPEPADTVSYGSDPDQVIDIYPAPATAASRSTVVLVHGGYWRPEYDRSHARSAASAIADAGHPTALIEYRRRPGDPDTTVSDVADAIRAVASGSTGLPAGPVVVVGHSAGGHLALVATADPDLPVAGCLALAPLADLRLAEQLVLDDDAVRAFLGCSAPDRADLDPVRLTPTATVVVLHGELDSVVPVAVSESFVEHVDARLVAMPDTGHFELIDPTSAAWAGVIAHLRATAPVAGIE